MDLQDCIFETHSLWDHLGETKLPVVLYGMGDGAVKLLAVMAQRGIPCAGIFASDGFARGQTFQGFPVETLASVESRLSDFIVLTAFASRLDPVVDAILRLSEKHPLFAPDLNIAGDFLEVFDIPFYKKHYPRLNRVFCALKDENSKKLFSFLINFKLSGKLYYIEEINKIRLSAPLPYDPRAVTSYLDAGAYNGDTILEAVRNYPNLKTIYAVEPDAKNYKKLTAVLDTLREGRRICSYSFAAWDKEETVELSEGAGRNSAVAVGAVNPFLQKKKTRPLKTGTLDSLNLTDISLIKYDVEGSEFRAIRGSRKLIAEKLPILRLSAYHNHRDLFELFELIREITPEYELYFSSRYRYIPAWDTEFILLRRPGSSD